MPTVSKIKLFVSPGKYEVFRINYSSKDLQFSARLPDHISDVLNVTRAVGRTQGECEDRLKRLLQNYRDALTVKEKYIMYSFHVHAVISEREEDGKAGKCILRREDFSFFRGKCALGLDYKVINRVTIEGETCYRSAVSGALVTPEENEIIVPWTEERERFLDMLKYQIEELILKAVEFFGTGEDFIRIVNRGIRLLPEGKENRNGITK